MSLVSLRGVSFTWGGPVLLENLDLELMPGERIGLLGRNGAGKSTLMKLIVGDIEPDDGEVKQADGITIGRLIQEVPDGTDQTVAEMVEQGLPTHQRSQDEEWKGSRSVKRILSDMKLDGTAQFATLSSGMKRRVLLAQAAVTEPDLLLLDEPTNHLDISSILWLENWLKSYRGTLLFVTHDRAFLKSLATRILEVDRGKVYDWTCNYDTFLKRKEQLLHAEEQENKLFDRKLAEEEVWIRQGIKARRTRNEGRVRALEKMRNERKQRRDRVGNVQMRAESAERSGNLIVEMKNVSFAWDGNTGPDDDVVIRDFSTLIARGDKIGIIGPNGAGKSTLLKLILDDLKPSAGNIRHGSNAQVIYFDQLREQINEDETVAENVGEGRDLLTINGKGKHIIGYLQDFLFTPERARSLARTLSGGERNRMLLARMFKRPSNIMVLDEPTNDLDAETLELLEELVMNYPGTVLLVSHDRAFLNNVVSQTIVFEGDGQLHEYAGGYDDYLVQRKAREKARLDACSQGKDTQKNDASSQKKQQDRPRKLKYKEQQELQKLPEKIEQFEQKQTEIHAQMADADFFKQDGDIITAVTAELDSITSELETMYARWEELAALE